MSSDLLRIDFHVHSEYSRDATIKIKDLIDLWKRKRILSLVCDHNTLAGSRSFWRDFSTINPGIEPILCEEITTTDGEIIGLFLEEEIPPMLPARDTIESIRRQGGLVLIPHPFDAMRKRSLQHSVLVDIISQVDIIEAFNARALRKKYNDRAARFARIQGKPAVAGSDAHFSCETGRVYTEIEPFDGPETLLRNLARVRYHQRACCPIVHVFSKLTRVLR